jgi:hypothetical protein
VKNLTLANGWNQNDIPSVFVNRKVCVRSSFIALGKAAARAGGEAAISREPEG